MFTELLLNTEELSKEVHIFLKYFHFFPIIVYLYNPQTFPLFYNLFHDREGILYKFSPFTILWFSCY